MSYDRTTILRPRPSCSCEVGPAVRPGGCQICAPENFCHHGVSLLDGCMQCVSEAHLEAKLDRGEACA